MAVNILDLAKAALTPDIMQKVSALVGENTANTQRALDRAIPSVLAGLLNFASTNTDGLSRLISLLRQRNYTNIIGDLSSLLSGGSATEEFLKSGKDLLGVVFGGRLNALTDLIANSGGVKETSASSLLSLVAPLLLGILGQQTASQGLNAANLVNLLLGQRDSIAKAAPAGLAGILGLANLEDLGSGFASAIAKGATETVVPVTTQAVETSREGSSVGKWLIPLLLAGLLIPWFFFSRG